MSLPPYLSAYYSGAQTWLNANANFASFPGPVGSVSMPDSWSLNAGSASDTFKSLGTVSPFQGLLTGPAGAEQIIESNVFNLSSGYYILDCEAGLDAGSLVGAGFQLNYYDASGTVYFGGAIAFSTDPDLNGAVQGGGTVSDTYHWRKLIYIPPSPTPVSGQVFAIAHITSMGSIAAANQIGFDLCGVRPASVAEIAAYNQYPAGLPVFPLLPGLLPEVEKTPTWSTGVATSASGVERRTPYWSYPKWDFALKYEVLRDRPQLLLDESKAILELFNTVRGKYGVFQFLDQDDYDVVNEAIAVGDGSTVTFQLYRHIRSWFEPVLCPFGVVMFVNGVSTAFTLGANGEVTFPSPPVSGAVISWTGGFFYPCRFDQDDLTLKRIAYQLWSNDGLKFVSVKTLS